MGLLIAALVIGQIISPGDLSRAHEQLDNAASCTKCHASGKRLSAQTCLSCHKELATRLDKGKGFHSTLRSDERDKCQSCHHEHQGKDFPVIDWKPQDFKHSITGFVLKEKHAKVECTKCHEAAKVQAGDVKAHLAAHPKATTFLGLGTTCVSCHQDPHQAKLGAQCQTCHDESGWHAISGFDHQKTDFPLFAKHFQVECTQCHNVSAKSPAKTSSEGAELDPAALKPLPHSGCNDCHKDPHAGKFGATCKSCHSEDGWNVLARNLDRAFHEKTRFPLMGAHSDVQCSKCHGKGTNEKLKGLAFSACAACHLDSHGGQLKGQQCESCHRFEAFKPVDFRMSEHMVFPLDGGHQAVGCGECHTNTFRLKQTPTLTQGKTFKASAFEFHPTHVGCESCHGDPHGGQFKSKQGQRPCSQCHTTQSFAALTFDHDKDTRFALTGGHAKAQCAACHRDGKLAGTPMGCGSCHKDVHFGQLGATCERCHEAASFKTLKFDHGKTAFPIDGKHEDVACARCHPKVEVKPKVKVQRFQPTPKQCSGCHSDPHHGAFQRFQ